MEPQGQRGLSEDEWWLHLYVMLSRATCLGDMLILRPPPRGLLERGPPEGMRKALRRFDEARQRSELAAEPLAARLGISLPAN